MSSESTSTPKLVDLITDYTECKYKNDNSIHKDISCKLLKQSIDLKGFSADLKRLIYVGTVEDNGAPIRTTRPYFSPVWYSNPLIERLWCPPTYSSEKWFWEFNSTFKLNCKQAICDKDVSKLQTVEQARLAIDDNIGAVATSWQLHLQTLFLLMFIKAEDLKKLDGSPGGLYTQVIALINSDGFEYTSRDGFIEQAKTRWDKRWKDKTRSLIDSLELLQEVIWTNEVDSKSFKYFDSIRSAQGSGGELHKYIGWFDAIKEVVENLRDGYKWEYGIGCKVVKGKCTCPTAGSIKTEPKKSYAIALGIGCQKDGKVECLCCCKNIIPRMVYKENLVLLVSSSLKREFYFQYPITDRGNEPALDGAYFGVSEVIEVPGFPKDKVLLIERGVLNMYITQPESWTVKDSGATYTKHIQTMKFTLGVCPGVCVAIKKPTN